MTVPSVLSRVQYNGNGVTTAFTFASRVLDASHLTVITLDTTNPLATPITKTLTTDYTVSGVGGTSCAINFLVAPATGILVTILRNVPLTQTTDYTDNDPFPAQSHEDALDKLTMIEQQQNDQIDRALKFPSTASVTLVPVLPAAPEDGYAIVWDGVLGAMKNGASLADITSASATAVAAAATATTQAGIATTKAGLTAADVITTHADVVSTHADVVTANAAAAACVVAVAAVANEWLFATSTTMADPGTGNMRFNNATLASVTNIAISALSGDSGNPNLRTYIQTWDDSSHSPRGIIRIEKNSTNFILLGVNGALTDNTTWLQIPVTVISVVGSFSAADITFVGFTPYGNDGSVTSVGLSMPAEFNVTNSPVIGSNTLAVSKATQNANLVYAGPVSGGAAAPAFRALVAADIPVVGFQPHITVFTSSGTFTTSANITTSTVFKIIVTGGGGGSGGVSTSGRISGGGGSGATAIYYITGLTPSTGYTIVVGAGGTAGANTGGNGGNGGDSTIVVGATTVTGGGGLGGTGQSATTPAVPGGAGGTATNGTINISGGAGFPGAVSAEGGNQYLGGNGGSSYWGGGGLGAAIITASAAGAAGAAYGSGAGGSSWSSGSAVTGAIGAKGLVTVEWQE